MNLIFIFILLLAVFGGSFVHYSVFGISVTYIVVFLLCCRYLVYIIRNRTLFLSKQTKYLLYFVLFGLVIVLLSFLGVNQLFVSDELFISKSFIIRQAFYIVMIPSILLFKPNGYNYLYGKSNFLFFLIYIYHIILCKTFTTSIIDVFLLGWLTLLDNANTNKSIIFLKVLLLIFTPYELSGEITNILVRILFIIVFFSKNISKLAKRLTYLQMIYISFCFIFPLVLPSIGLLDANSAWRFSYWRDELIQFMKTLGIGVGFGTSYATLGFVGDWGTIEGGPFGATSEYTVLDQLFVTGPHNSYISVLFRLGVIGITLLLKYIFLSCKLYNISNVKKSTVFVINSALIILGANVGLESPKYLFLFIFAFGLLNSELSIKEEEC